MPRLIVTAQSGLEYGGHRYKQGEELELPDDQRSKQWALAFVLRKLAKRSEPVVLGTPPAAPSQPAPEEPKQETWFTPPWETIEQEKALNQPPPASEAPQEAPAEPTEPTEEQETVEGQTPRRGRGRYARRDLRPEE